jgi:hypothetical protein
MYKCEECGQQQKVRVGQFKKVIETRVRKPPYKGTEIVKEINICPECHEEMNNG